MATKPWTAAAAPSLQDDIEVPIDPVVPEEREEPVAPKTEVPELPPTPLPVYTEEDIEGLLLKESQEQQAKNQVVALAAAVQQVQAELVEIRARLAQLEGAA